MQPPPTATSVVGPKVVFQDDMENGTGGWVVSGSTSKWHRSTHRSNSTSTSWYYGIEGAWNFATGARTNGTLTSQAINLAGATQAELAFYEWSELEADTGYDRTRVRISTNGSTWSTVFESHGTSGVWVKRTVNLGAYLGKTVYVRFWFDSVDGLYNESEGWYVDDVRVTVSP